METFDTVDAEILAVRETEFNQVEGPRVGDFLKTPEGFLRFTHDWGDGIQTTVLPSHPCNGDASFYLGGEGYVSFSGSLNPSIDKTLLQETGEKQEGSFWFFHHNFSGAGRGVHFRIPCRVFELNDHSEPTYENQLWHARKLLREQGPKGLRNPHALTGEACGCGSCFCCAALEVLKEEHVHDFILDADDIRRCRCGESR